MSTPNPAAIFVIWLAPRKGSLEALVLESKEAGFKSFDFVIIDADRSGVTDDFNVIWDSPGFIAEGSTVCIDTSLYKGQKPVQFMKENTDVDKMNVEQNNGWAFLRQNGGGGTPQDVF